MQAIKEKLHDMGAMRKAKAEAKEEEKVPKVYLFISYTSRRIYIAFGGNFMNP